MEIYKDVIGYEGIYKVSNFGNVKSLIGNNEKILKLCKNGGGYSTVNLHINSIMKTRTVHQLVAGAFLNHKPSRYELVINHKDFNRSNNNVNNLEIVTTRENANQKHLKSSSQYTGVSWDKNRNKWSSQIVINKKLKFLGRFINELDASEAYQKALKDLYLLISFSLLSVFFLEQMTKLNPFAYSCLFSVYFIS